MKTLAAAGQVPAIRAIRRLARVCLSVPVDGRADRGDDGKGERAERALVSPVLLAELGRRGPAIHARDGGAALPLAAAALAFALAGCGFRPLYEDPGPSAGGASVGSELAAVEIAPIPDRVGQLVRNDLLYHMDASEGGGAAQYRLDVRLAESISELAVERTGFATRSNLRLAASYSLTDLSTGRQLVTGRSRAISSYNIVDASFSTLTAQNAARERAASRVAEDIRARLAAYFASYAGTDPAAAPAAAPALPPDPLPPPAWR